MDAVTTSRLLEARRLGQTAAASGACPADASEAYAAQQAVAQALGWFDGNAPMHWKSGGPSRDALQTHAPLPPAGVWSSPAQAGQWPFHLRCIEAEIALRLAFDVDAPLSQTLDTPQAASALIDALCVSIEIVDSRWAEGLDAPPLAKLADLQSHGALVLGEWVPFNPALAPDWATQTCSVQIGDRAAVERRGSHPLGDPAYVLPAWLRHATQGGQSLRAGTVVTTGTWVGILSADAGDLVRVAFAGIGSASVQL